MIRKGMEVVKQWKLTRREWFFGGCMAILLVCLGVSFIAPLAQQTDATSTDWKTAGSATTATLPANNPDPKPISTPPKSATNSATLKPTPKKGIKVDVKGAVKSPGVYQMTEGDRILDAIEKAGGLMKDADSTQLDLALKLQDEMVVYVPIKGEKPPVQAVGPAPSHAGSVADKGGGKISINSADETALEGLPGVGPVTAKAILDYRKKHGAFRGLNDLLKVPGIGEKTAQSFKDLITF